MTATTARLDLSLRADPSSVRAAREAVATMASVLGVSRDVVDDMRLCVSEAVTNAVRHAYPSEPGEVQVSCDRFGAGTLVVVRDFGLGATPPHSPQGPDGGFGWKIIEVLADGFSVTSSPEDGTEAWMSFGTSAGRAIGGAL
jgi:anti-sigma regulatory factor (Ser/Thr protein kinase)